VILNADKIEVADESKIIFPILEEAIKAADPYPKLLDVLRFFKKTKKSRKIVIAAGKAAPRMFYPLRKVADVGFAVSNVKIEAGLQAGHPYPDFNSYEAARIVYNILKNAGPQDIIIFLISGGASSLLGDYVIGPERLKVITRQLMNAGANIYELNTVRKHLSYLKGGRAAKIAEAKIYAYIVSDVIGDDLSTIASGLTAPDNTTFEDAISVLNKYNVNDEIVLDILKHPERYSLSETVKPDEFPNERVKNIIVCKNSDAIAAAAKKANELGLNAISLGTIVAGEAKTEALRLYSYLKNAHEHTAIISGGEPIVKVKGNGKGGRNQEFVLSLVNLLKKGEIVASVGTDGIDGPTDAAGAVADWTTMDRARKLNIDPLYYLANNDSYSFFEKVNGLIKTGPTGTNVMDVQIMIKL